MADPCMDWSGPFIAAKKALANAEAAATLRKWEIACEQARNARIHCTKLETTLRDEILANQLGSQP